MNSLEGRTLVWLSWDEAGVFTAATRQMINDVLERKATAEQPVKLQLIRINAFEQVSQSVQRQPISLITLVICQQTEIAAACKTFASFRGRIDQPVCVSFLRHELLENVGLLLEAGAQIVVTQLPSWQRCLPRIISRAPLTKHGFHPLTTGLLDRLPWSQIDS